MKPKQPIGLLLALASLTVSSITVAGAPTQPQAVGDFAFSAKLNVDDSAPFYQVKLPDSLYRQTVWPDLRDVRVFNGQGQPLPFSLVHYDNVHNDTRVVPMTLFAINSQITRANSANERAISLTTSDGVTVNIPLQESQSAGQSYLLKAAGGVNKNQPPNRFILSWPPSDRSWQTRVAVYYSQTTQQWQPIVTDAPLIDLTSGTEKLVINHIELGDLIRHNAAYYLLVFKEDKNNPPPMIDKVEAVYSSQRRQSETVMLPFSGRLSSNGWAEYYLPTPQPIQKLHIQPAQQNAVLPLEVEVRNANSPHWTALPKQVVYRLIDKTKVDESIQAKPIALNGRLIQAIRLKAVGASWGNEPPTVFGERKRMTLIFNAQGNGPYFLAWGARAAKPQAMALESLIPPSMRSGRDVRRLPIAELNDRFELAKPPAPTMPLEQAAATGARWQKFVLWGILIFSVVGLGLFTLKIWQEIKQKQGQID